MASPYKRGLCQWQALIRRKGFHTQSRVFATKAEAETWSATVESEIGRGLFASRKETGNTALPESLDRSIEEHFPALKSVLKEECRAKSCRSSGEKAPCNDSRKGYRIISEDVRNPESARKRSGMIWPCFRNSSMAQTPTVKPQEWTYKDYVS